MTVALDPLYTSGKDHRGQWFGDRLSSTRRPRPTRFRLGFGWLCAVWLVSCVTPTWAADVPTRGDEPGFAETGLLYAYNKQNPRPAELNPPEPKIKPYRPLRQPPGALESTKRRHVRGSFGGERVLIGVCTLLLCGTAAWWLRWRTRPALRVLFIGFAPGVLLFTAVAVVAYELGDKFLGLLYYVFPALVLPAFLFPWLFPSRESRKKPPRESAPRSARSASVRRGWPAD